MPKFTFSKTRVLKTATLQKPTAKAPKLKPTKPIPDWQHVLTGSLRAHCLEEENTFFFGKEQDDE